MRVQSFTAGFLTAAALSIAWFALNNFGFQGGHAEDSPSGKYNLTIIAPMTPAVGGTYNVTLRENATGNTIRNVKIRLNSEERTKPLRDLPVAMVWDSSESWVDIMLDGAFLVRLSTPPDMP